MTFLASILKTETLVMENYYPYISGTGDTSDTSDTSDKANLSDASKTNASVTRLSSYWVCTGYCRDPESLQCVLENLTFRENALSTLLPPPC